MPWPGGPGLTRDPRQCMLCRVTSGAPAGRDRASPGAASRMSDELRDFQGREALVIDDDEDFRAIVSGSLLRAGLHVTEVDDATKGFERATSRPPDIILMDLW